MLVHAAKCQGYSFYHFWVIKRKPTRGKITPTPQHTHTHTHTHTQTHTHRDWVNVCHISYKTDLAMRGVWLQAHMPTNAIFCLAVWSLPCLNFV